MKLKNFYKAQDTIIGQRDSPTEGENFIDSTSDWGLTLQNIEGTQESRYQENK